MSKPMDCALAENMLRNSGEENPQEDKPNNISEMSEVTGDAVEMNRNISRRAPEVSQPAVADANTGPGSAGRCTPSSGKFGEKETCVVYRPPRV